MPLTPNLNPFITCAVTGSGGSQDRSPHVPRSPEQIANSAIDAAKAGAAVVHCHVRDPETGVPNRRTDLFREVVDRIRDSDTDEHPLGWVGGADPKDVLGTFIKILEARSKLTTGDLDGAREILDSEPEAGGWIAHARAEIQLELGDAEQAERLAREVITAQPHHAEGYLILGAALEMQGRTQDAIAAYEEAARINPNETASLIALAQISEAAGEVDAAERRYREALDSNAPSADAALRLAALYYDRGRAEDARSTLSAIGLLDAAGTDALIRLSRAEAKAGYRDDALDRLARARKRKPNDELDAVYAELGGRSDR